jgi:hypothetical protein
MITITIWQWASELVINISFMVIAKLVVGRFLDLQKLLFALYCFCVRAVLPSFYLMGNANFRADFDQHGFRRAFWERLRNFSE